ncbi:outer membrane lipoprotein carrier protein LolA [Francisellaceae bacterium]|nr:outer membrane lipoprotein carrier protein LolA [Francisellaceae bacterium]
MKKIIPILALLVFTLFPLVSIGQKNIFMPHINTSELQQIQDALSQAGHLQGDFIQTRYITLLSSPLVSSGTFSLSKKTGLIWQQAKPFPSKLEVTATKLIQKLGDNPATIMTKEKQPIIFSFTNIFLSIFKGNTEQVKQYFKIHLTGDQSKWTITLKPKNSPLNKAISNIQLSGEKYVKQVIIHEQKGNKMTIQFSNVQAISAKIKEGT